ncbi:MAG: response regulator [Chloroflexales bacterium]|nr:response regulator [Chloroflexales bacterium]
MTAVSILIVEDEAVIARDLQFLLEDLGYQVPAVAATADVALGYLSQGGIDLVLLDIHLANSADGITVAEAVLARWGLPVIFLTAHADPATVARAEATAPYGYLLKPFHEREVALAVQMALAKSRSDRQLRASERLFATTLHSIAEGVIVTDGAGCVVFLNPAAETLTGWPRHEAVGQPLGVVLAVRASDDLALPDALVREAMASARIVTLPAHAALVARGGEVRQVSDSIAPIWDEHTGVWGAVVVIQDVTAQRAAEAEQRALERKLREARELERLGLLAGGIAHDFNNIVTGIHGYVEQAQELAPAKSAVHTALAKASRSLQQATALTSQLLTYARHHRLCSDPVALNRVVHEVAELLQGKLTAQVVLQLDLAPDLPELAGDETEIRQVVLNLLTNGAEALGTAHGQITVTTSQGELPPELHAQLSLDDAVEEPGGYVCLRVHDTGPGIDPAILGHLFDPFVTTKAGGHGWGLAVVQGVVRRHRGVLQVQNMVGAGACFEVWLPQASAALQLLDRSV